jgi:hypothetical protein
MKRHAESHLDHGLTTAQVEFLMETFAARDSFFIETVELPEALGTVPCGLHGPITGDAPIAEADVTYAKRGTRAWKSRLIDRPAKPSRSVTVIAGPHEETCPVCNGKGEYSPMAKMENHHMPGDVVQCGYNRYLPGETGCVGGKIKHACIVYTAFGGPLAPQEPGDVRRQLEAVEEQRTERHRRGEPDPGMGLSDEVERGRLDPDVYGKILVLRKKRVESDAFWAQHALSREQGE